MRLNATTTVPGVSPRSERGADELERQDPLEHLDLGLRERLQDEWLRVECTQQKDVAVVTGEQEARPGRAALGIVRPLHLVEHEHLARRRRHLDRAADDRSVLVDALLPRDEADGVGADLRRQPAMCLLREHPQRPRVDAATALLEHLERVVRLAGVRRAEMRHHGLGLDTTLRERDLDRALGALHSGLTACRSSPSVTFGAARALGPAASLSASAGHDVSVAARTRATG